MPLNSSKQSFNYATKSLKQVEKELVANYKIALTNIRAEIVKLQEKLGDEFNWANMTKYNRLSSLSNVIETELKKITKSNYHSINATRKDVFLKSYDTEIIDSGISLSSLDTATIKKFLSQPISGQTFPETMKDVTRDAKKKLDSIVTQTLIQGKSLSKTSAEIKDAINTSTKRAITIARTETLRAMTMGQNEWYNRMKDRGFDVRKKWIAKVDDRTRPDHLAMNGSIADESGIFTFPSGVTTTGPRESGVPSEDINCRCRMITVVLNSSDEIQNEEAQSLLEENV